MIFKGIVLIFGWCYEASGYDFLPAFERCSSLKPKTNTDYIPVENPGCHFQCKSSVLDIFPEKFNDANCNGYKFLPGKEPLLKSAFDICKSNNHEATSVNIENQGCSITCKSGLGGLSTLTIDTENGTKCGTDKECFVGKCYDSTAAKFCQSNSEMFVRFSGISELPCRFRCEGIKTKQNSSEAQRLYPYRFRRYRLNETSLAKSNGIECGTFKECFNGNCLVSRRLQYCKDYYPGFNGLVYEDSCATTCQNGKDESTTIQEPQGIHCDLIGTCREGSCH